MPLLSEKESGGFVQEILEGSRYKDRLCCGHWHTVISENMLLILEKKIHCDFNNPELSIRKIVPLQESHRDNN